MSAVMMDNWSIESAIAYTNTDNEMMHYYEMPNQLMYSWCNFLTAIILWDEIWYYDNSTSRFWQNGITSDHEMKTLLENILYPIDESTIDVNILSEFKDISENCNYSYEQIDVSSKRNIFYRLLSNSLGINLLLHNKRESDVGENYKNKFFNRLDIFNTIDKELQEYYQHINDLIGRQYLTFNYPVLFDYVRSSAANDGYINNSISELKTALEIRNNTDLIRFRDEVSHIEILINQGNTQALLVQLGLLHEIATDLTNKYKRSFQLAEFNLSFAPSISKKFQINIKHNEGMKIHTSFIKKLIKFGINERRLY